MADFWRGLSNFWMGLYSKGLVYGGEFAFQNRLGYSLSVGGKFTVFALLYFVFEGNFQVQAPPRGGGGVTLYTEELFFGISRYVQKCTQWP